MYIIISNMIEVKYPIMYIKIVQWIIQNKLYNLNNMTNKARTLADLVINNAHFTHYYIL